MSKTQVREVPSPFKSERLPEAFEYSSCKDALLFLWDLSVGGSFSVVTIDWGKHQKAVAK